VYELREYERLFVSFRGKVLWMEEGVLWKGTALAVPQRQPNLTGFSR
jgi:hypothetical protein